MIDHHRTATSMLAVITIGLVALAACASSSNDANAATNHATATSETIATDPTAAPRTDPAQTIPPAGVGLSHCEFIDPIDQVVEIDSRVFRSTDRVSMHFTPCTVDQPTPNPIIYLLHGAGADETQRPDVNIFAAADAPS